MVSALPFYASVIFKSNSWTSNCLGQVAGQISGEFTEVAIPFQRVPQIIFTFSDYQLI